jgi:hemolysin D
LTIANNKHQVVLMVTAVKNKSVRPSAVQASAVQEVAVATLALPSTSEWSSSLQTVLDQPVSALPNYLALGGVIFVSSVLIWAWVGQIDEVASASGKLIPQGEVYQVNPIEAGKIERIAVKEGQVVKKGDVLAELDTELTQKEIERLQSVVSAIRVERVEALAMIDKTRLQAQSRVDMGFSEMQAQQVAIRQNLNTVETNRLMVNQMRDDAAQEEARLARLKPLSDVGDDAIEGAGDDRGRGGVDAGVE